MDNRIHTSDTGFIVSNSPNVNAVYGPWESLELARSYLELHFTIWDDNFNEVIDIPTGTTVAIYRDPDKRTVTEYWWSDDNLVLKTYGNNYYALVIENELGLEVNNVYLGENGVNTPMYLFPKRLDNFTNSIIDKGYILYSLSAEEWSTYIDNPQGILTTLINDRCVIEWRDDNHNLVTSVTLPVTLLPQITQTFYAYNNSTTPPSYLKGVGNYYLHSYWTPNDYGLTDWSLVRKGVTDEFTIEWSLTRTRTSSIWEELSNPVISARWGLDGISSDTKLILYTYTSHLVSNPTYFETSRQLLDSHVPTGTLQVLDESYTFSNITWYKSFKDVSIDDRYCYVSERYSVIDNGKKTYGNWTYPALYANYAVDGKDGSTIEYIYCRSKSSELSAEASAELRDINRLYSTTVKLSGKNIDFSKHTYWTDNPQGVSAEYLSEFSTYRTISHDFAGNTTYSSFIDPFIWASFGELGPDGPGLEYIYILTDGSIPDITTDDFDITIDAFLKDDYIPTGWSDNPLLVTNALPVLWMSLRKGSYGAWEAFSSPVIWNQFSLVYELKLSNDNCSIPSSSTGIYTVEAAELATKTKVLLYLGKESVTEYTIIPPEGYELLGNNVYALTDTSILIDASYHAEFKALVNNKEVAVKSLSIILSRGKESYSLFCQPNSRIWYGGNDYSSTLFNLQVYHLSETGEYKVLSAEELTLFKLGYLSSDLAEPTIINFPSNNLNISEGESSDIIITLRNHEGEILDTEIIDSVDYSKIKGKDNNGIIFAYLENINIPKKYKDNLSYINKVTETTIRAYRGITPVDITIDNVSVYNLTDLELSITVSENNGVYYINLSIPGDLQLTYTIHVPDEENILSDPTEYTLVLNITLVEETVVYELHPSVGYLVCNLLTGVNVENITFNVVSSDDNTFDYSIKCYYGNNTEPFDTLVSNIFNFSEDILTDLKNESSTTYLNFHLIVDGKVRDIETIPVSQEPEVKGHYYSIDLSNPYVQLPIGLSNDVVTDWTKNEIKVYLNSTKVPSDTEVLSDGDYPKFSVTSDDANVEISGGSTHWIVQPNESKLVHFTITVLEDKSTEYTFTKSQQILLVDSVVYSLSSNPNTIVANPGVGGTFTYTPIVLKLFLGVIDTITDLESEGLEVIINDEDAYNKRINYDKDTSSITVALRNKADNKIYDYDTIAIVRNGAPGADGLSVKYVYGRSKDANTLIDPNDLSEDEITKLNASSFNPESLIDSLLSWSDSPRGISENYPLEFISQSTKTDDGWSLFSSPVVHSLFGKKGLDGDGVEYLFTACSSLITKSIDSGGFSVENAVLNPDGKQILGCSLILDEILGWYDEIPNLSRLFPNLYMTMRRKVNGQWGYFSLPVLWNLYSSKLDLFINNDNVIIDDNSNSTTIEKLTETLINVSYCGSSLDLTLGLDVTLSDELSPYFELLGTGNTRYLSLKEGVVLSPTSGLVTYTYTKDSDTVSTKQSIYIKNFSVGEGYKLILEPNIITATYENNQYNWPTTRIKISLIKILGTDSSEVSFPATEFKLYANNTEISDIYTILAGSSANITPFIFSAKKNDVLVDSLSVGFSTKGADGKDGADGKNAYIKMRGLWLPGVTYYCNESVADNDSLQTDVVSYKNGDTVSYYLAKATHESNDLNSPVGADSLWNEVAFSELTLTLELFITNKDGEITGGFVDINKALNDDTDDGIVLWAGASGSDLSNLSAADATFKVTKNGVIYAKEGIFEGTYLPKLKTITIPELSPTISPYELNYDPNDENNLKFYGDYNIDLSSLALTTYLSMDNELELSKVIPYLLTNIALTTPALSLPTGINLPLEGGASASQSNTVAYMYAGLLWEKLSMTYPEEILGVNLRNFIDGEESVIKKYPTAHTIFLDYQGILSKEEPDLWTYIYDLSQYHVLQAKQYSHFKYKLFVGVYPIVIRGLNPAMCNWTNINNFLNDIALYLKHTPGSEVHTYVGKLNDFFDNLLIYLQLGDIIRATSKTVNAELLDVDFPLIIDSSFRITDTTGILTSPNITGAEDLKTKVSTLLQKHFTANSLPSYSQQYHNCMLTLECKEYPIIHSINISVTTNTDGSVVTDVNIDIGTKGSYLIWEAEVEQLTSTEFLKKDNSNFVISI